VQISGLSRGGFVPGFGTAVADYDFLCASYPTDCVASGLSDWTNDGRGDEPPFRLARQEVNTYPGIGRLCGEAGEDSVALSDGHCAHQC